MNNRTELKVGYNASKNISQTLTISYKYFKVHIIRWIYFHSKPGWKLSKIIHPTEKPRLLTRFHPGSERLTAFHLRRVQHSWIPLWNYCRILYSHSNTPSQCEVCQCCPTECLSATPAKQTFCFSMSCLCRTFGFLQVITHLLFLNWIKSTC